MKHVGATTPAGLLAFGPLVRVRFAGSGTPAMMEATLMVDTGAQSTMVDESIPDTIGAIPFGYIDIVGVSGKPETRPVFELTMLLVMRANDGVFHEAQFTTSVASMPALKHPTCQGLIGRDFLAHMRFVYDGPSGVFELANGASVPAIRGLRPGPNEPCICGSGRKFKKCHGAPGRI